MLWCDGKETKMAEETPGGKCQLSKSKEEFQSGWGASCFMKTPERWLPA